MVFKQKVGLLLVLWGLAPTGFAAPAAVGIYPTNPSRFGNMICVSERNVACFDVSDIHPKWVSTSSQDLDEPVVTEKFVLAGSALGVWAFDRLTGRQIWNSANDGRAFSPTVLGTKVFVSTETGRLVARNIADGTMLWSRQFDGWIYPPAVVNNRLITGGQNAELVAMAPTTGKVLWRIALPQELVYRLVPGTNNDVIATTFGGEVLSVLAVDGSIRWRERDEVPSFSPTLAEGRLFFVGLDQQLRARDADSGRLLWRNTSRHTGKTVHASQTRLFALSEAGEPVILDPRNGLELTALTTADRGRNTSITPVLIDQTLISFTLGTNADPQRGGATVQLQWHAIGTVKRKH